MSTGQPAENREDQEVGEDDDEDTLPEKMTEEQVAQYLGRSTSTIRNLADAGKLTLLSAKNKRRRYAREEVVKYAATMRAEQRAITRAPGLMEAQAVERHAERTSVVDAFDSSQNMAKDFFKLSTTAMRDNYASLKNQIAQLQADREKERSFYAGEYTRLTSRIETLEGERAEFLKTLDEMRKHALEEEDRRLTRELVRETFREGKTMAKAIIAMKMKGKPGKGAVQASALDDWFKGLGDQRIDAIAALLTDQQRTELMGIMMSIAQAAETEPDKPAAATNGAAAQPTPGDATS